MTIDYVKLATEIGGNMTDGQEINRLKLEVEALKQQLHTDRENYQKEVALVREDAQIEILRLEKRNSEHQKLNGELQEKLSQYEDKAAHYRRKAIL